MNAIEAIRKRPGMYVGDCDDGSGVVNLVLDVLANAYDQHLAGRCTTIEIELAADGTITVTDDGPGFAPGGGDGVPALDALLTRHSDQPTVDDHRPHVHLGLGGLGLVVVNALSERFELSSTRDGITARIACARGEVIESLTTAPTDARHGTTIRFRPDPTVFRHPRVPRVALTRQLEDLAFLTPGLTLRWTIAGDELARAGLVGRVAIAADCALDDVASHRASYETPSGPIDVDVALAWRAQPPARMHVRDPEIDCFVNLDRTGTEGTQVDGLRRGIAAFLGGGLDAMPSGLVAAIAVVLADVKFGNPTKEKLVSPEVTAPVADATRRALDRWAETHADQLAALRARIANDD